MVDIGGVCDLDTPVFLVDKTKVERNCTRMSDLCDRFGVQLRAQTKTHKTLEGAILQTGGKRSCIVTSTIAEAEFYASHGFDDIIYGFPLIPRNMKRCAALTEALKDFHVMLDNDVIVDALLDQKDVEWSVFLKVDCGNKRAGVWWDSPDLVRIARRIASGPNLRFRGIYVHCGDSYGGEPGVVRDRSVRRAREVVATLKAAGVECGTFGIGSTPTCSLPDDILRELTEIHPGNYIFYDVQQKLLGSCTEEEIACRVMTRVIGHYPHRKQMLIDCRFNGLTKQGWGRMKTGYGVFQDQPNLSLVHMTQEIGFVEDLNGDLDFSKYPIDSVLFIYPYHSCATAAMYPIYYIHRGDKLIETWTPIRGWEPHGDSCKRLNN